MVVAGWRNQVCGGFMASFGPSPALASANRGQSRCAPMFIGEHSDIRNATHAETN